MRYRYGLLLCKLSDPGDIEQRDLDYGSDIRYQEWITHTAVVDFYFISGGYVEF
jgi:hypothetical protein